MFITCLDGFSLLSFSISPCVENEQMQSISQNPAPTEPVRLLNRSRYCERRQLKQGMCHRNFSSRYFRIGVFFETLGGH